MVSIDKICSQTIVGVAYLSQVVDAAPSADENQAVMSIIYSSAGFGPRVADATAGAAAGNPEGPLGVPSTLITDILIRQHIAQRLAQKYGFTQIDTEGTL